MPRALGRLGTWNSLSHAGPRSLQQCGNPSVTRWVFLPLWWLQQLNPYNSLYSVCRPGFGGVSLPCDLSSVGKLRGVADLSLFSFFFLVVRTRLTISKYFRCWRRSWLSPEHISQSGRNAVYGRLLTAPDRLTSKARIAPCTNLLQRCPVTPGPPACEGR